MNDIPPPPPAPDEGESSFQRFPIKDFRPYVKKQRSTQDISSRTASLLGPESGSDSPQKPCFSAPKSSLAYAMETYKYAKKSGFAVESKKPSTVDGDFQAFPDHSKAAHAISFKKDNSSKEKSERKDLEMEDETNLSYVSASSDMTNPLIYEGSPGKGFFEKIKKKKIPLAIAAFALLFLVILPVILGTSLARAGGNKTSSNLKTIEFLVTSTSSEDVLKKGFSDVLKIPLEYVEVAPTKTKNEFKVKIKAKGKDAGHIVEDIQAAAVNGDPRISSNMHISKISVPKDHLNIQVCPEGMKGTTCSECRAGFVLTNGKCVPTDQSGTSTSSPGSHPLPAEDTSGSRGHGIELSGTDKHSGSTETHESGGSSPNPNSDSSPDAEPDSTEFPLDESVTESPTEPPEDDTTPDRNPSIEDDHPQPIPVSDEHEEDSFSSFNRL